MDALPANDVKESAIGLLRDLIQIPSHKNESEVVQYLATRFDGLGIPYRTREITPDGRLNIVANWGEGDRSLIFNSHMDTVSPGDPDQWSSPPLNADMRNGKIYGRGSADAKGSLAAMISALEAIVRSGRPLNGKLILMAAGYEEESGIGTQAEVNAGVSADAAIIGEPTDLQVHVAHKGVLRVAVTSHGRAAHASEPWEGVNAITNMGRVIACLDRLADDVSKKTDPMLDRATLAVTKIQGGIGRNIIPPECRLVLDRRLLTAESSESALKEIVDALNRLRDANPDLTFTVNTLSEAEPAATPIAEPIVQSALRNRSKVLNEISKAAGFLACCDMRFLANQGRVPSIVLGPGSLSQAHKVDEHIPVDEYLKAVELYRRIALDWFQNKITT